MVVIPLRNCQHQDKPLQQFFGWSVLLRVGLWIKFGYSGKVATNFRQWCCNVYLHLIDVEPPQRQLNACSTGGPQTELEGRKLCLKSSQPQTQWTQLWMDITTLVMIVKSEEFEALNWISTMLNCEGLMMLHNVGKYNYSSWSYMCPTHLTSCDCYRNLNCMHCSLTQPHHYVNYYHCIKVRHYRYQESN